MNPEHLSRAAQQLAKDSMADFLATDPNDPERSQMILRYVLALSTLDVGESFYAEKERLEEKPNRLEDAD